MAHNRPKKRRVLGLALLVLAEAALACVGTIAVMRPAIPQVLDERFPFLEDRRRRYQQQDRYQQGNQQQWNQQQWGADPQSRQSESSRAPAGTNRYARSSGRAKRSPFARCTPCRAHSPSVSRRAGSASM